MGFSSVLCMASWPPRSIPEVRQCTSLILLRLCMFNYSSFVFVLLPSVSRLLNYMSTICLFWEVKRDLESAGVVLFWLKSQHRSSELSGCWSLRSGMHRLLSGAHSLLVPSVRKKETCCPEPVGCWQSVVKAAGVHIPRGCLKRLVLAGGSVDCGVTSGLPDLRRLRVEHPLLFCLFDIVLLSVHWLCIEDLLEVTDMLLPPLPCYPLFFSYLCKANRVERFGRPFYFTASGLCLCTFNSAKASWGRSPRVQSLVKNVIIKK